MNTGKTTKRPKACAHCPMNIIHMPLPLMVVLVGAVGAHLEIGQTLGDTLETLSGAISRLVVLEETAGMSTVEHMVRRRSTIAASTS
jgi:hypothetical protein